MAARKSGMATGTEVARISVKVSPDTTKFKQELKEKLEAIEKALGKDGAHTELDVDTDKAEKKVARSTQRMSRKKVELKIDTDAISRDIDRTLGGALSKFNKFDVANKLFWNPQEAKEATRVAIDEFKRIQEITDKRNQMLEDARKRVASGNMFLTTANTAKMDAEQAKNIASMQKKLDTLDLKWDRKMRDWKLSPTLRTEFVEGLSEMERVNREFKLMEERANAAAEEVGRVFAAADKSTARTVLLDYVDGVKELGGEAKKSKTAVAAIVGGGGGDGGFKPPSFQLPSFGTGFNGAGWAAILAGILVVAQPLIGLITTTLLALPGLISLVAAPITAVMLGLEGFKKAAEAVKAPFEELKGVMSKAAEDFFTPVLKSAAETVFPLLQQALPKVTKGLSDMAQGAVDAFKGAGGEQFRASVERIGAAFTAMKPGMEGFFSGIIGLIDQFTLKLPGITEWFNNAGKGFADWVKEISTVDPATGVSKLSTAFDQLGGFIQTVLDLLGQLGKDGLNFMSKPGSLEGFLETLKNIAKALTDIAELSGKINEKWDVIFGGKIEVPGADENFGWGPKKEDTEGTKTSLNGVAEAAKNAGVNAEEAERKVKALITGNAAGVPAPGTGSVTDQLIAGLGKSGDAAAAAPVEPPKVPEPDTAQAEAKLQEYQGFVEKITADVKASMEQASQGQNMAPPDLEGFKSAWQALPGVVDQAMRSVADSVRSGGDAAAGEALLVANRVVEAMQSVAPLFQNVGLQMMAGLATGIQAGSASVITAAISAATNALNAAKNALGIKSPSRKFMEVGKYSMDGMAIGMESGFSAVLGQAKDMATRISEAFAADGDPTGMLEGFDNKEVNRMEKVLGFEMKRLNAQAKALDYQAKVTGNEALKAQAEGLRMKREELSLQKDMIDLTQEFSDLEGGGAKTDFAGSPTGKLVEDLIGIPQDYFKNISGQFMNDIGMSGGGALGALMDYGQQLGNKYIFNVSNVDEALAAQQRQTNREAAGVVGR